jgi:exodeoxyribonuclease VII large subunit
MDEETYTVGELNREIRHALDGALPEEVWVRGEVQRLQTSSAGHTYFALVQKDDRRQRVQARLDVVLFRGQQSSIQAQLRELPGARLRDDVEVRIRGRVDYYEQGGRLQLVMTAVDPVFTIGRLAAERDRLLRQLRAEGVLRRNAATELPVLPLRIGLVTSKGSAAYHDFVDELDASGYAFRVGVVSVRVQGDNAARRIKAGLRRLGKSAPDVVVLVRGGGSPADLAPFDTEIVARAIADCSVPVLTGIGHEIDRTVADEVAHTAFKTPTSCAQFLVEQVDAVVDRLDTCSTGVVRAAQRRLAADAHALVAAGRHVSRAARSASAFARRDLAERTRRVRRGAPGALVRERADLARRRGRMEEIGRARPRTASRDLDAAADRLRALDPRRVLERGYTITRDADGRVRKRVAGLRAGARLVTDFADGQARSTVDGTSTRHEEHGEEEIEE